MSIPFVVVACYSRGWVTMLVSCQTWLPFKWSILIKILHGPATLVTGARCGIGRAVAISLAAACARIVEKFMQRRHGTNADVDLGTGSTN